MFWVGMWNCITESRHRPHNHTHVPGSEGHSMYTEIWSLNQALVYTFGGTALLLICDAHPQTAGFDGSFMPKVWYSSRVAVYIRGILALAGTLYSWTGSYDLLNYFVLDDNWWKDLMLIAVGMIVLEMCSSISAFAYIYPDEPYVDPPTKEHGFKAHALHNLRAFIAVVAQNCVWLGAYDCMENYSTTTLDRELCYVLAGVMLMIGTRSYVANSWIVTEFDENHGADDEKLSFATNMRMMLSISGQVLNNTGAWTILDQHIWKDTYLRNGMYMAVGVLVMAATECMLSNAGVDDFAEEEEEDGEEDGGEKGENHNSKIVDERAKLLSVN